MRKPKNSILARNLRAKERERVFSSSQSTPASWQEESALLRTDSESHHHSLPERSSRLMTLFPASQFASVNARSLRLHIFPIPLWFCTSITVTSSQDILWCHPSHCPLSSVDLSSVDLIRKIFLTFTSLTIPFTFFFFLKLKPSSCLRTLFSPLSHASGAFSLFFCSSLGPASEKHVLIFLVSYSPFPSL